MDKVHGQRRFIRDVLDAQIDYASPINDSRCGIGDFRSTAGLAIENGRTGFCCY